jgi:hypothetical protein
MIIEMEELRVLSPTAILGYGFPIASFNEGLKRNPHVIGVDAGSTDPGPYYLGAGVSFTDRNAVKRDLDFILRAVGERKIPLIIGTAGGSGGDPHLDWNLNIIREIAEEKRLKFKMAAIGAEIDRNLVLEKLAKGHITPLYPAPELTKDDIENSVRIVGQMGVEPIIRALKAGAEVIVAGRCYDPAVFAALPLHRGYDHALAVHMGKILECASIAATPGSGSDCLIGYLGSDYFRVEPLSPIRKCTTLSVAAHTLYEKTDPYLLPGPGGVLDLREAEFIQETDRAVKVRGSRFNSGTSYRIKLEGVKRIGYRTISIAGIRDPIMIKKINDILTGVRERVHDNFKETVMTYFLDFKVYGKNGVMGPLEPSPDDLGHELGIIIEAVSASQETANTICSFARSTLLHYGYEGRLATAGNLAFPYSPSDFKAGEVYAFSVYHLMDVLDPSEFFPVQMEQVGG